jgi:hypothetical protein
VWAFWDDVPHSVLGTKGEPEEDGASASGMDTSQKAKQSGRKRFGMSFTSLKRTQTDALEAGVTAELPKDANHSG